jgi:hypothetical protein
MPASSPFPSPTIAPRASDGPATDAPSPEDGAAASVGGEIVGEAGGS